MNPSDFNLNSDYPLDKAILLWQGTFDFVGSELFNHGLSYIPLIKIVWSLTADFAQTYGLGNGPDTSSPFTPFTPQLIDSWADSTSVNAIFGTPGSTPLVYVRVYGFMPSNINNEAAATASSADNLVLNTDYNYSKLYLSGITASSSVSSSTETVNHSLGYIPQTDVWYDVSGSIHCLPGVVMYNSSYQSEAAIVSTSQLQMLRSPYLSSAERFHYRIYADRMP